MTAALIGQLCSEGKLRLDTSLKEIFKDREDLAQSSWGEVTVQELLHTAAARLLILTTTLVIKPIRLSRWGSAIAVGQVSQEAPREESVLRLFQRRLCCAGPYTSKRSNRTLGKK